MSLHHLNDRQLLELIHSELHGVIAGVNLTVDLIKERFSTMAKTLQDIIDQGTKVLEGVTKNTDLDNSIITMLNAETQTLKDLRQQLADAAQDPDKLEALGTLMDQVIAKQETEAQAKADAITANTGV